MNKENTCCFTGYREFEITEKEIRNRAHVSILFAMHSKGITHFICGGATGFDMIAVEIIMELKKKNNITLEIALPFKEQDKYYSKEQKQRFAQILKNADKITILSETNGRASYAKRNRYMVDNSSLVIGLFDGRQSGANLSMLLYAQQLKTDILTISHQKDAEPVFRQF